MKKFAYLFICGCLTLAGSAAPLRQRGNGFTFEVPPRWRLTSKREAMRQGFAFAQTGPTSSILVGPAGSLLIVDTLPNPLGPRVTPQRLSKAVRTEMLGRTRQWHSRVEVERTAQVAGRAGCFLQLGLSAGHPPQRHTMPVVIFAHGSRLVQITGDSLSRDRAVVDTGLRRVMSSMRLADK